MCVTFGIVPFDVVEAGCVFKSWFCPVQPSHPSMQSWISGAYVFQIDFEMLNVDGVKANECCEQADVSFGDASTKEVGSRTGDIAQVGFSPHKGGKDVESSALIRFLRSTHRKGQ